MTFGALAFVEFATARNAARSIARSPGRLALWALAAFVFLILIAGRIVEERAHPGAHAHVVSHAGALQLFGFFTLLAGLNVALPATGRLPYAFRSKAEARLLSSTGLSAQNIAVWLQVRAGTIFAARFGLPLVYVLLSNAHWSNAFAVAGGVVAVAASASIVAELPLPAFLLRLRAGEAPVAAFGWMLAALGALYGIAGIAQVVQAPSVARPIMHMLRFDPAFAALWFLSGSPAALALAVALPLLLVLAVIPLAADALPDLYAVSMRSLELIESSRRGRVDASEAAASAAAAHREPPRFFSGVRTLLWTDWTTFARTRGATAKWLGLVLGSALLGAFVLFAERFGVEPAEAGGIFGALWALALVIPLTASISLADEIAKPIWWLAPSTLRERLAIWSVARAWRGGVALGTGPAVLGIGSADWPLALASLPVAFIAWWFLTALGVALYAAFPSKIDTSGPAAVLRVVVLAVLLAPLVITCVGTLLVLHAVAVAHAAALALGATTGVAVVEALLLIEFATFRIGGNAVGTALLERST